jgi:hypothetical protein
MDEKSGFKMEEEDDDDETGETKINIIHHL